jgi:hypothetical protein
VDPCNASENDCDKKLAVCVHVGVGKHECVCNTGYETANGGKKCTNILECASSPCMNGGTCNDGQCKPAACVVRYSCTCDNGWAGSHCEVDVSECASYPCVNGATCVDGVFSYGCVCGAGFTGFNCEVDVNECTSTPCQNAATCIDSTHISMQSTETALGSKLKVNVDAKYLASLSNSVKGAADDGLLTSDELLQDPSGAALLKALQAQIASELGIAASLVSVHGLKTGTSGRRLSGKNHAIATTTIAKVAVNSYICLCTNGYSGYNCEADKNECASSPCLHGGTCAQGVNSYTCTCAAGYTDSPRARATRSSTSAPPTRA